MRSRRGRWPVFAITSSSETYIVGTPRRTVASSSTMASTTRFTSKKSDGKTMELPWVKDARNPRTRPKQWNSGGGQHITSSGVSAMASPTKRASLSKLLVMLVVTLV